MIHARERSVNGKLTFQTILLGVQPESFPLINHGELEKQPYLIPLSIFKFHWSFSLNTLK
jgi:hypothetical protein